MRVFKVTGWSQYKTDCAYKIDRVQIADTEQDAMAQVIASILTGSDRTYKLDAVELFP